MKDLVGKTVFVAGGSSGLGKELAKQLAARGAHATIFARRQRVLDEARDEILAARASCDQQVIAISLDLTDASEVEKTFRSQPQLPDQLYCVAGGTAKEIGFLVDISTQDVERCLRNNYLTSAYAAHALFRIWTEHDRRVLKENSSSPNSARKTRRIVFISSAAALVGLPGYIAYTPAKAAQRALADTLRQEALRYSGPASHYTVHCAFPSNFMSPAFAEEQKRKPQLTKRMEGTDAPPDKLARTLPSSEDVARYIIRAVEKGEFAICSEFEAALVFANMTGPSPKLGLGVVDTLLGMLMGWVAWPVVRRWMDAMRRKDGESFRERRSKLGQGI